MRIHKNNLARLIAAILCFIVIMAGSSNVSAFFDAVANPGHSGHEPAEILIGGMLFCIALIAAAGVCRIFFDRN